MTGEIVGSKVGQFRVLAELGKGGMGEVYVAFDETLERKVALKAIRKEHRLAPEAKARFLREARVLSQLAHPNICQIHGYVEDAEADFLVLELISGRSLSSAMREGLDPQRKLAIAAEITAVLVAAHSKGIVHRDLKPDNVMITEAGQVKVLDFGLSRAQSDPSATVVAASLPPPAALERGEVEAMATLVRPPESRSGTEAEEPTLERAPAGSQPTASVTTLGTVMGTIDYMSPEQARGEVATSASDIYALGVLLQELFTGERAHGRHGTVAERIARRAKGDTQPTRGADPELAVLVERMKSLEPSARPTAIETGDRLRWIAERPARQRRRALAIAAVVVLAAFAVGSTVQAVRVSRERNRANQEAERSRQMLEFLVSTFDVASAWRGKGPTATAREMLDAAAARLDETAGQPELQASLMSEIADLYAEMAVYAPAEDLARRALALRERELRPSDPLLSDSVFLLARVLRLRGKDADARALHERALAMREKTFGPDDPAVALSLVALAASLSDERRFAEAQPLCERAIAIYERKTPNDPHLADALAMLASTLSEQSRYSEAEPLRKRALAIQEKARGPDHFAVATALQALAGLYHDMGRYADAESLARRAVGILEKKFPPGHPVLVAARGTLARTCVMQKKFGEAEEIFQENLRTTRALYGPRHWRALNPLYNLTILRAEQGRKQEAIAYLREAVTLQPGAPLFKDLETDDQLASLLKEPGFAELVEITRRAAANRDGPHNSSSTSR